MVDYNSDSDEGLGVNEPSNFDRLDLSTSLPFNAPPNIDELTANVRTLLLAECPNAATIDIDGIEMSLRGLRRQYERVGSFGALGPFIFEQMTTMLTSCVERSAGM